MINIVKSYLTNTPCYQRQNTINVQGLMLHSVGCAQSNAQVFIKNWNNGSCNVGVHAFADETGIYETLPCSEVTATSGPGKAHRAWHCGSGPNGSANSTHISLEMTEPNCIKYVHGATFTCSDYPKAQEHVRKVTKNAAQYFAVLCVYHNLDPLGKNVIISHKEGHDLGIASGHADPDHLWSQLNMNYNMDSFRQDVYKRVQALKSGIIYEEDDEMDIKTFEKLFNEFRGTLRDNDCSNYSADARKWAIETGMIEGTGQILEDGNQNYAWQDLATREQIVTLFYRFAKYLGKV